MEWVYFVPHRALYVLLPPLSSGLPVEGCKSVNAKLTPFIQVCLDYEIEKRDAAIRAEAENAELNKFNARMSKATHRVGGRWLEWLSHAEIERRAVYSGKDKVRSIHDDW